MFLPIGIMYMFTNPLTHEQDVTQGQFLRGLCIYLTLCHKQDVTQIQFLSSLTGLNSVFLLLDWLPYLG